MTFYTKFKPNIQAYNDVIADVDRVVEDCEYIAQAISDTTEIDKKIEKYEKKIIACIEKSEMLIHQNAAGQISSAEFGERYDKVYAEQRRLSDTLGKLQTEKQAVIEKGKVIHIYAENLKANGQALTEWNGPLFILTVDGIDVLKGGILKFRFFGGQSVEIRVETVGRE